VRQSRLGGERWGGPEKGDHYLVHCGRALRLGRLGKREGGHKSRPVLGATVPEWRVTFYKRKRGGPIKWARKKKRVWPWFQAGPGKREKADPAA